MDVHKLKLDSFKSIGAFNFPDDLELGLDLSPSNFDVIIYFIHQLSDVQDFLDLVRSAALPSKNRAIMVYKKGQKNDVNRDTIAAPLKELMNTEFKLRAPMLCSLSEEYSAFVMSYEFAKE
ncbi:MAG: hypothetical protein HRT74_04155 [Flavobacteriales bacterium]|nr:hypothetical protein [Flavobacteriales bacterium]